MVYDIAIIGAGVIGAFTARELSKYNLNILLIEKENDVSCGASKANSGIVHGGFDPDPDTLKALMNSRGVPLLYEAAEKLKVPILNNGSFVCAFDSEGEKELDALHERAIKNNIPQVEIVSGDKAREEEPALSEKITKVLVSRTAGIISPYELCIAAVGNAMKNGVELRRNFEVAHIDKNDSIFVISSVEGERAEAKRIINCAGCLSGKIASLCGDDSIEIIARKGEYMLLDKTEGNLVKHTIFQIPTKSGKGVLVTPTVHGNLLVGPTAEAVDSPEFTDTTAQGLETIKRKAGLSSEKVDYRAVITSFTGVRASISSGDFIIEPSKKVDGLFNIAAIDSPGLTSCVAIAQYAVDELKSDGLELIAKQNWDGEMDDPNFFSKMSTDEKNEFIKKNSLYGKMVCRCEQVTEGEIRAAIRREPRPCDIDGIKRRTRSSMGRCQGGFCVPTLMRILSEETGIPMEQITKKGKASEILSGKL